MNAGNETRIRQVLNSQIDELNKSGIILPHLDQNQNVLPSLKEPTAVPASTPQVLPELPQVNPTLPAPAVSSVVPQESIPVHPTDLPKIVPTVQVPSLLP